MYLDYYGLREHPFNVTSDPGFLYLSSTHKEALNHLVYGINQRKGFIEITGEIGAGKTTLCRTILKQLSEGTKTSLIFNPNLPEAQLLEAIILDFGLVPVRRNKISYFRQLNDFLLQELSCNNNVVLIIDEAQNLSKSTLETVRMLSNLETEKEKLLQIVLVGQPELRNKLDSPDLLQLKQRLSIRFHISALKTEEIKEYINHRLFLASGAINVTFDASAIELITAHSGGIPRLINRLCDKSLLLGFVLNKKIIDQAIIQKSIDELHGNISFAAPQYEYNN